MAWAGPQAAVKPRVTGVMRSVAGRWVAMGEDRLVADGLAEASRAMAG